MLENKLIEAGNIKVVRCESGDIVIKDGQTALDFAMSIGYEFNCRNIIINKSAISEDFFKLSTGIAGEVTQKFVNYRYRIAIVGDFSGYTSNPFKDYMYECNNGKHLYFVKDENEALKKLMD